MLKLTQWNEIKRLLQDVPHMSAEHKQKLADPETWEGVSSRREVYQRAGEVFGYRPRGVRTDDGRNGFVCGIGEMIADALGLQARPGPVPPPQTLRKYMSSSRTRERVNAKNRKSAAKALKQGRENPQYVHRPEVRESLDSILEPVGCFVDLPDGEAGKNQRTRIPVGCGGYPAEMLRQQDVLHIGYAHSKANKPTCVYVVGLVGDDGQVCGKYGCTNKWSPHRRLGSRRKHGFDVSEAYTFWFSRREAASAAERELSDFINNLPDVEFNRAMPERVGNRRTEGYTEQFAQQYLSEVLNKAQELWSASEAACNLPDHIPAHADVVAATINDTGVLS